MSEIKFRRDTSFRKELFTPDSFAHPAKMDAQLLIWIVEKYTKVGETILDPMAGMGTTMLACMLGRNCILVELEQKFVDMAKANWEKVKMMPQLGCEMGNCQILQGDARNLEGLFKEPKCLHGYQRHYYKFNDKCMHCGHKRGDLALVDGIITSPPYAEVKQDDKRANDPEQIDKRAREFEKAGGNFHTPGRMATIKRHYAGYASSRENIGNLPYGSIDSVITSPPYEGSVSATGGGGRVVHQTKREQRLKEAGYKPEEFLGGKGRVCQVDWEYSGSQDNIGNLKADSYLSAMLQVYQQCYKVLKPQGLMILVTKNFIRNKQEVKLDEDTIKLCEQAGFQFMERHYRKLTARSFWRVIYQQKYPDAPVLDKEDILVFQKELV